MVHSLSKLVTSFNFLSWYSAGPIHRTSETVEFVIFNHKNNHLALQSHSNLFPLKSLKKHTEINIFEKVDSNMSTTELSSPWHAEFQNIWVSLNCSELKTGKFLKFYLDSFIMSSLSLSVFEKLLQSMVIYDHSNGALLFMCKVTFL